MQQQSITCIVLIGDALFTTVNTFNHAWFQWEHNGLQRISHFRDEQSAISILKKLCDENYKVFVIWDRPTQTGDILNKPEFEDIVILFRDSFSVEVDHLLCNPDDWLKSTWLEWMETKRPISITPSQTPGFRQAYTRAMQHWVFSLCLAEQLKFDCLLNKDVNDLWQLFKEQPPQETDTFDDESDVKEVLQYLKTKKDLFKDKDTSNIISFELHRRSVAGDIPQSELDDGLKEAASSDHSFRLQAKEPDTWKNESEDFELTLFYYENLNSFEIELEIMNESIINRQYKLNILVDNIQVVDSIIKIDAKTKSLEFPTITEVPLKTGSQLHINLTEIEQKDE